MNYEMDYFLFGNSYKKLYVVLLDEIMKEYNLCLIDVEILIFLSKCKGNNTSKDILELNAFTKGHISQSIKRLVANNHITTSTDLVDKRILHLELTEKAKKTIIEIEKKHEDLIKIIFDDISEDEIEIFKKVCNRARINIKKYGGL